MEEIDTVLGEKVRLHRLVEVRALNSSEAVTVEWYFREIHADFDISSIASLFDRSQSEIDVPRVAEMK